MQEQRPWPGEPAVATGALAAFDLVAHLERQRQFSFRTFGPGPRTAGVIDHIRRELIEVEKAPGDITEWVDVILLALDGAWRAGFKPEEIAGAIALKQSRNEARTWPDWRTADPDKAIEHVRSAPTPDSARVLGDRLVGLLDDGMCDEHGVFGCRKCLKGGV
ncbi:DUF550 domain-containing protein [Rhodopseudomonas sp. BR0G17]|nr:DUF550 domain-containing protein [Rhodopseudomonas sp. BR0G17]